MADLAAPAGPGRLARVVEAWIGLTGWRRAFAAALCGALVTAAMPPLHLVPLLLVAVPGLLLLLDGVGRLRSAFGVGWWFGFGHFATGLYWVGIAFLVEAERYAAVMPLAVLALTGGLALFPAVAVALAWRLSARPPVRLFLLAGFWLVAEWLRATVFTGFPWNLLGSIWTFAPVMLQPAALFGVWGLSVMTLLAAGAPVLLRPAARASRPVGSRALAAALLALPLAAWVGGALRLAEAPDPAADRVPDVRLRLVQPAIPQDLKWHPDLRIGHVARQLAMTREPGFETVSHVVWPEAAVPFLLSEEGELRRELARAVPPGGLLLTGAPRGQRREDGSLARLWNSLYLLGPDGELRGHYDKFHLVPFGEYMPLRWIPGLEKLAVGQLDFSSGPGPVTLSGTGLPPFSPLICYEVIFPGRVTAEGGPRPQWLLNLTNDAWFGTSSGPYQHLAAARLRAVEEGLPLVRVANNGISAVIDGYGRMRARLGLDAVGVVDSPLPRALPATPFARLGDFAVLALVAACLVMAGACEAVGRRRSVA